MFKKIDTNNSGKISSSEFNDGLKQFGIKHDESGRKLLWEAMDDDGSGKISHREFRRFLTGGLPGTSDPLLLPPPLPRSARLAPLVRGIAGDCSRIRD